MSTKKLSIALLFLTLAGLFFSGYLSSVKLFTDTCAFGESCPYFLGYPACWYGFIMYLIMFIAVILGITKKIKSGIAINAGLFVSLVGILFAGKFVLDEVATSNITGSLGLSTCVYGFIFYVLIFIFSLLAKKANNFEEKTFKFLMM